MILIKVNRNVFLGLIITIFIILLVVNFFNLAEMNHQYETLNYDISEIDGTLVSVFLISSKVPEDIEIFDIEKGKVIKALQVNEVVLSEVRKYLKGITGLYPKVKAFPDKGYIIKIPFEPNIMIKNPLLNNYNINSINKVFILLPEENAPYLLVLDSRERPYFYNFKGDITNLLKSLDFETDFSH